MSTEQEDELQRAYRAASSDAADAPPPALRRAILAEAAAAARRREPANDARYWLGAAAGIAVLGMGLVLWRQVPHQLPGDAPWMAEVAVGSAVQAGPQASAELPDAVAVAVAPVAQAVPASPPPVATESLPQPVRERRSADAAEPAAKAEQEEARMAAAPGQVAPPPPPASTFEEITVTGSRVMEARRSAPPAAAPAQGAADIARNTSSPQLLRQYFPQAYAGTTSPRTLWLVQDAAGNTLSSGELAAGQEFATINPKVEAQFRGQRLGPWVIEEVRSARGQPIRLGIARLQYNPGQ